MLPLVPRRKNEYVPVPSPAFVIVRIVDTVRSAGGVRGETGLKLSHDIFSGKPTQERATAALKPLREVTVQDVVRVPGLGTVIGAHASAKSGVGGVDGAFTVTPAVTDLESESTTVIFAVPSPMALDVKIVDDVVCIDVAPSILTTPTSLVYISNGGTPPIIWNGIFSPRDTSIALGLIPSEDVAGVTVTVAVPL